MNGKTEKPKFFLAQKPKSELKLAQTAKERKTQSPPSDCRMIRTSRSPSSNAVSQRIWTPTDLSPRSKSADGYGLPLRRFEPPYQTFLLSILYIMFGN